MILNDPRMEFKCSGKLRSFNYRLLRKEFLVEILAQTHKLSKCEEVSPRLQAMLKLLDRPRFPEFFTDVLSEEGFFVNYLLKNIQCCSQFSLGETV